MNNSVSVPYILLGIALFVVVIIGVFTFYKSKEPKTDDVLRDDNHNIYVGIANPYEESKKIHRPSKNDKPSKLADPIVLDDSISVVGTNAEPFNFESLIVQSKKPIEQPTDLSRYLNIERARRYITKVKTLPAELTNYTLSVHNPKSTTVYPGWDTGTSDLQNICNMMDNAVRYIHTLQQSSKKPNPYPQDEENRAKLRIDDFVNRLVLRFNTIKNYNKDPWGKNWYAFSSTLCSFLAHYILLETSAYKEDAATIILNIITSPIYTLGTPRKAYASVLLGPWLLAHYVNNSLNSAIENEDYKIARDSMIASVTKTPYDEGLHMDGTIFKNTKPSVFTYSAFHEIINERNTYYFYMDRSLNNQTTIRDMWDIVMKKITHPTINLGLIGIYGRISTNEAYVNPQASYGIEILPFAKFIRYNTEKYQFSARGQDMNIACYQMDRSLQNTAKYWIQYRRVHKRGDKSQKVSYPTPGVIYHQQNHNDIKLVFRKDSNVVESFTPLQAVSFVMRYKNIGVLFNRYEIMELEAYVATEYVVINSDLNTITIYIQIENKQTTKLEYVTHDDESIEIPEHGIVVVVTKYDLNNNTASHQLETYNLLNYDKLFDNPNIRIDANSESGYFILYDQKNPKVLFPKTHKEDETLHKSIIINDNTFKFKFNFNTNQYEIENEA